MNEQKTDIDKKANAFDRYVRRLPRVLRIFLGFFLILGGILGFLPILGFWMVPLGLAVLAIDIPIASRVWLRLRSLYLKWTGRKEAGQEDGGEDNQAGEPTDSASKRGE